MQIKLLNQYKSLYPFESENLSGFTVITGKNGSGKSQLIELLNHKSQRREEVRHIDISTIPFYNKVQYEGVVKQSAVIITPSEWKRSLKKTVDLFMSMSEEEKLFHSFIIENNLIDGILAHAFDEVLLSSEEDYINMIEQITGKGQQTVHLISRGQGIQIRKQREVLTNTYFKKDILKAILLAKEVGSYLDKKVFDLKEQDFYAIPIDEYWVDDNDLFLSNLETVFYSYLRRRHRNDYDFYRKEKYGRINNSISDLNFIKKYPEPWGIINDILEKYKIDFYFKGVDPSEFTEDIPLGNPLFKKSTETNILFEDLSSGEKVIIGLILKLFLSDYYERKLEYPDLLLLDEPDAHLHPEMSKLLIDILNDVFVKQLGIQVILSTHSPSTIALCPDDCVYQLENGKNTQLKKVSKDTALELLTSFIPTLSINYKNHRQVFVESPTDVIYYQGLQDKYQQDNKLNYKLYFIANSHGKGNCDQVYRIVEEVRKSGNVTSFGIVDWDLRNKFKDNIVVHGFEERYSVENFILDPIYVFCHFMMSMNDAHSTSQKLEIDIQSDHYQIGSRTNEDLQRFVEIFFNDFETSFPAYKYNSPKVKVEYLNKRKLEIPKWYLEMQGHEIVTKIKKVYSALDNNKYKDEGSLQKELCITVIRCYPFVPLSTIRVIESLSKN